MFAEERRWAMKREERTQTKVSSIIRWCGVNFNRRGLQMKRAMTVLISFIILCCVSMDYGYAEKNKKTEAYTVMEVSGDIFQKSGEQDTLVQVTVGEALNQDAVLNIVKDASLKMKDPDGKNIVLEGPSQGELKENSTVRRFRQEHLVQNSSGEREREEGGHVDAVGRSQQGGEEPQEIDAVYMESEEELERVRQEIEESRRCWLTCSERGGSD
jgi:hypothetical protein